MMKSARKVSASKISEKQISRIEKKLIERSESLRTMKSQADREATAEVQESHADEMDQARARETADATRMMAETMRMELLRIQDALERIRVGRFGICEDCEASIPFKRLEIRPEARLCIDCQSEEERHFGRNSLGRGDFAFAS